jgi:hypothetical protein
MPRRIRRDIAGHEVFTVEEAGLKGLRNGELLRAASERFDALMTVDRNLIYQQNLQSLKIAVLVLVVRHNSYNMVKLLVPQVLVALEKIKPGEVVRVAAERADT